MRRTALCFGLLAVMAVPAAAGAQADSGQPATSAAAPGAPDTTDPTDAIDATGAAVDLESELSALMSLGAFAGDPSPRMRDIHDRWASSLDGLGRDELIWWVEDSDNSGNVALDRLRAGGLDPTAAVTAALGVLSEADYAALRSGGTISVAPIVYNNALGDLDPVTGTVIERPRRSVPVADSTPARPTDAPLAPIIGGGVAALFLSVAALELIRRRRGNRALVGDDSVGNLLDAARKLSASLDAEEIATIAIVEAAALTEADGAAFVAVVDGVATLVSASAPEVIDATQLDRGLIARVLSTGLPTRAVVSEAVFGTGPVAVIVVPVLRSGRVVAAICVRRRAGVPFSSDDQELVCRLSPFVAGAIDAASLHDGVTELSLTDGLTSLANRRRLDRDLPEVVAAGRGPVGFLMIDIDYFKTFNDLNGHVAGDVALRQVAEILALSVRPMDVVYRYGGEEFCVLLAEATAAEAATVAERVRAAVEAFDFDGGSTQPGGRVTVSVGLALTDRADRADAAEIKQRADGALYAAKNSGRNRIAISP